MLTMDIKSQNTIANNMPSNEGGPRNNLPDQGKHVFSGELVVVSGMIPKLANLI